MRIYSDKLTPEQIHNSAHGAGIAVFLCGIGPRVRVRRNGWTADSRSSSLEGRRWKNTGKYGADSEVIAATWDQHGRWFARLFALDPNAVIVAAARYNGAQDFHSQTKGRYLGSLTRGERRKLQEASA